MNIPLEIIRTDFNRTRKSLLQLFTNFDKRFILINGTLGYSTIEVRAEVACVTVWRYHVGSLIPKNTRMAVTLPSESSILEESNVDTWVSSPGLENAGIRYLIQELSTRIFLSGAPVDYSLQSVATSFTNAHSSPLSKKAPPLNSTHILAFPLCFNREQFASLKVGDEATCLVLESFEDGPKGTPKNNKLATPKLNVRRDGSISALAFPDPVRILKIKKTNNYALVDTPLGEKLIHRGFLVDPMHLIPYL